MNQSKNDLKNQQLISKNNHQNINPTPLPPTDEEIRYTLKKSPYPVIKH